MEALIKAASEPDYPAEIVGVFSNRADAGGVDIARASGVATEIRSHKDYASREDFDAAIDEILNQWRVDIVCLAGFMRIFSDGFATRWTGRMINIHPSLLPRHKGLSPQQQALDAGDSETGCTVHWMTAELDAGPGILQARVPILPGDTADELSARILAEEHKLYPKALALVANGSVVFTPSGR